MTLLLCPCAAQACVHTNERDFPSLLAFFPWADVPLTVVLDHDDDRNEHLQLRVAAGTNICSYA